MERQRWRGDHLAKRCAPTFGGCNRCSFFSAYRLLSSIPRWPLFRGNIIFLAIISRPSIRRRFSVIRHTAGLDRNPRGGQAGWFSLLHCWFFGRLLDFG